MSLREVKRRYLNGTISKPVYIDEMHRLHSLLAEYAGLLSETDVKRIEISEGQVKMVMRTNDLELLWDPKDKRTVPVETFNFGRYEPREYALMSEFAKESRVFFDIGANIGWYSLLFGKRFPDLKIHSFEPLPRSFQYLKKHIEINGCRNIEPYNRGFGKEDGELEFFFNPAGSGNAALVNHTPDQQVETHRCRVGRLDDFVLQSGAVPDFVKCDVEGAELFVFQGAVETLRRHRPAVFTEMLRKWAADFHYDPNEIIDLFRGLGYRCYSITDQGKLREFQRMDESTVETNFFFLDPQRHAKQLKELSA